MELQPAQTESENSTSPLSEIPSEELFSSHRPGSAREKIRRVVAASTLPPRGDTKRRRRWGSIGSRSKHEASWSTLGTAIDENLAHLARDFKLDWTESN